MQESPVSLAERRIEPAPPPERNTFPVTKERETRQFVTESVSRVITGSVNTDASRFDPNNISPLTPEEQARMPTKGPENLAYDKANILSLESRADATTTYQDWFSDFERWATH